MDLRGSSASRAAWFGYKAQECQLHRHSMRPSSTAELLAHQLESRARTPSATEAGPAHEQMGYVDARGDAPVPTDPIEAPLVQAQIEASAPAAAASYDGGDTDVAVDEQ